MPDSPLALQLLRQEHDSARRLLAQLRVRDAGFEEARRELCEELGRHMRLEEQVFYPALARLDALTSPLTSLLTSQHDGMRAAMAELTAIDAGMTQRLDQAIQTLDDLLSAHLREEEGVAFEAALGALEEGEMAALAVELEHCREAQRGAFGVG